MIASIYVHMPFCQQKCAYCDFESYAGKMHLKGQYIDRVLEEAKRARDEYGCFGVPSVFIGGGTPSLLTGEEIERVIGELMRLFDFRTDTEITVEANPGTVSYEKLSYFMKAGVNRISFGAQAAQDRILSDLGRIHKWADVKDAVRYAQDAGLENINVDLMYALPGQTMDDFVSSIQMALDLGIRHISMYSLILEEGTPLFERAERGEVTIPGDEESVSMQERAIREIEKRGMRRYEISNYAYPGFECRHNIVYWTRGNYLGLGSGAHSLMNENRFFNPCLSSYLNGETHGEKEEISVYERMEEAVMLETRMTRGLDMEAFKENFGSEKAGKLLKEAESLINSGFAGRNGKYLYFTREGLNVQNALIVKLLKGI